MSKKLSSYEVKIKAMFEQVNGTIRQMLSNLQYLYSTHGIKYNFDDDKFQFILRILTPFEILSYFRITPIDRLLDPKQCGNSKNKEKSDIKKQMEMYNLRQVENIQQPLNEESLAAKVRPSGGYKFANYKNYMERQNEKKALKELKQEEDRLNRVQLIKEIKITPGPKPHVHKGLLSQEQEQKICKWIRFNYEAGHMVSKSDAIKQARILSGGAVGSTGWGRGFFSRHSQLLCFIKRAKPTERSQVTFMTNVEHPFKKPYFSGDSTLRSQQVPIKIENTQYSEQGEQMKYLDEDLAEESLIQDQNQQQIENTQMEQDSNGYESYDQDNKSQ